MSRRSPIVALLSVAALVGTAAPMQAACLAAAGAPTIARVTGGMDADRTLLFTGPPHFVVERLLFESSRVATIEVQLPPIVHPSPGDPLLAGVVVRDGLLVKDRVYTVRLVAQTIEGKCRRQVEESLGLWKAMR